MQQCDVENLQNFGNKVKELRLNSNKSLNEFVLAKGYLTTATWSRIENGLYDFKFSTLLRVAKMLDIAPSELLDMIKLNLNFSDD